MDIDNIDIRNYPKGMDIAITLSRLQEFNTERDKKFIDENKQYVYRDMDGYARGKRLTNIKSANMFVDDRDYTLVCKDVLKAYTNFDSFLIDETNK